MKIVDKHSIKYHALVAYMKQGIHSTPFAEIKQSLQKKGWPEDWVIAAHEDILKSTFEDTSDDKLAEGEVLLNSVKENLPKRTSSLLSKKKDLLKQKKHRKKSSAKKHTKGRFNKRNAESFLSGNLHFHFDDDDEYDYAERLLKRKTDERHFYSKSHHSQSSSPAMSSDATKENFDALKEAIKLAQSVIRAQGAVPITVKTSPYQATPTQPGTAQSQSPVAAATAAAQSAAPNSQDEQISQSDSAINEEERRLIEEERKALQRERDQLLEERRKLTEDSSPKKVAKKSSPVEVEENKGNDNSKYLESKLQLLEERLKNVDYSELNKNKEMKNEYELEEVEFTKEPVGDRAQTGIVGLDPIIQGGFRRLSTTVVAGGPGSGKTIFAMAYLINGIRQFNENGVYITFEQSREELYALFKNFGWDLEQLEKEKRLSILRFTPEQIAKIIDSGGGSLRDSVDAVHAGRIVVDSISDLLMLYHGDMAKRRACVDLFDMFEKLKTTTLVVSEQEVNPLKHISNVLEYQVDGVILLYNERVGDVRQRAVEIFKMRGTKHAGRIFPLRITDQGILINSNAAIKQG